VPAGDAANVVNALMGARMRGKSVRAEIARPSATRERRQAQASS
jgi:hypothetical protein